MVLTSSARCALLFGVLSGALSLAACDQSLFDEGKGGSTGPGPVGAECPAECLADAARDFNAADQTKWRYLEDTRNRAWAPMAAQGKSAVGGDTANAITTCADKPSAPACKEIPGALLISSAGGTATADPAIELKLPAKRVVKVGVRAFVPSAFPEQQIRIYRNSREDSLFTGPATPGTLFEQAVSVDVLPEDRILVALAPVSGGAQDVAMEVFISDVGTPSSCQMGLTSSTSGIAQFAENLCGSNFSAFKYQPVGADTSTAVLTDVGPFPEMGRALRIPLGEYLKGVEPLSKDKDFTLQFWMRVDGIASRPGYPFSDHDLDRPGGLAIIVYNDSETQIQSLVSNTVNGGSYAGTATVFPNASQWNFVRLVHKSGEISLCLNDKLALRYNALPMNLNSPRSPYLGQNVIWEANGSFFNGAIDDVRMLSQALSCK